MKKMLVLLMAVLMAGAAHAGAVWTLEEGAGDTTTEEWSGTLSDPFVGTWTTATAAPGSNFALSLDGTGYVATNLSGGNIGIGGITPKTIAGWIQTTATGSGYNGWIWGWSPGAGSVQGHDLRLCLQDGYLRFEVSSGYRKDSVTLLNDGLWHYVAAVIGTGGDYTLGNVKFYIDGTMYSPAGNNPSVVIDTDAEQSVATGAVEVFLGAAGNVTTATWNGQLDNFAVYNDALNADQLYTAMTTALVPEPATMVLLGLGGLLFRKRR